MAADERVKLAVGRLWLELSPSIGGSIFAFEWRDGDSSRPILRQSHSPLEKAVEAASFPLVPYVNRIRDGRFTFRGREVRIAPNMAGDPSPLHGQGWLNPWSVDEATEHDARLSFRHRAGEWPRDYEAWQSFSLDERGLTVTLGCRNMSEEPMPYGLGQHPYFPCGPQTRLDTQVSDVWTIDEKVLPVEKVPAEGRYDLRDRRICGQNLDNGFGGWGAVAHITDSDWPYALRMSSPEARFFQVYSPATGGIFVAEPVTHANAALNATEELWPGLGLKVLGPGDDMRLDMRLDVIERP